jgi:hypothetical protein
MTYKTFQILIQTGDSAKWIEVVAVDSASAHADIMEAYEGVQIIQTMQVR